LPPWLPPGFYLLLALLFLWRSTFTGDVFLPALMLGSIAPWTAHPAGEGAPPWNPLRWDGIAQFYPWRHFAAQTVHAGTLPLWNPYQFCGTPFVANSQSAVLYPGNLLFYLLPTAPAFNASALLHLTLCGWFTYLLLRRLRCADMAALLGGVVYTYSAWQIAWLQLPTFLATSCWFPLLLCQVHALLRSPNAQAREEGRGKREETPTLPPNAQRPTPNASFCSLALVVGMILLAGHLQIAFYGLLAGSLWAVALLTVRWREEGVSSAARGLGACIGGLLLGGMLAAPQLLPTLELSRVSHRVGKPTPEGYRAYTDYALPLTGLWTLTLPEAFGNDTDSGNPYWGYYTKAGDNGTVFAVRHNTAETAAYIGIVPLLLGILALVRALRRPGKTATEGENTEERSGYRDRRVLFFGGFALGTLLLALGTPLNALFYFGVPGFGESGSPARSLVLWSLAWSALSAFGLNTLLCRPPTRQETVTTLAALGVVFVLGLALTARALLNVPPGLSVVPPSLSELFGRVGLGWIRLGVAVAGGAALLLLSREKGRGKREEGREKTASNTAVPIALALVIADLFLVGISVNPTAPPDAVYPQTPGLKWVQAHIGHERIFPVNQRWSLYTTPPAVLPPNAAMVYGLRDVQGYDSLFTGQYKAFANQFARPGRMGIVDSSPPEVGNILFFQNPNTPGVPATAALYALTPSVTSTAFVPEAAPAGQPVYDAENEMAVFALPHPRPRAELILPTGTAPVTWNQDDPTRVTLTVDAPSTGSLTLSDQFYPGWHATLNDHPVPITRQPDTPIFRAVAVPPGHHVVAFRYEPASFRVGLYLACLSCCVLALIRLACYGVGSSRQRSSSV
jgi:hypothetical protein